MIQRRISIQGQWSSRIAFVLASTGAAVGLGNIWKFPYMVGANGGGAFVLVYLSCVLTIGLPVMMAEVMLGRRGRRNPISTMRLLSEEETGHARWQVVGWAGVLTGFSIFSYYSVIAGWALAYVWRTASGMFTDTDAAQVAHVFAGFLASPGRQLFWHSCFMIITTVVVAKGVKRGLERAVTVLMPILFLMLAILVAYAVGTGHFREGVHFLFNADISKLSAETVLTAMGQAFFTLSLGMGAIMAYGAYFPEQTSIFGASLAVVIADTVVALLAGLAIFPVVFAHGLNPNEGPGLVFLTLPIAFGNMPAGTLFGSLFFLLLVFAAWASSISLVEAGVAWLVERFKLRRPTAAWLVGGGAWLLGFVTIFSFSSLHSVRWLGRNPFQELDFIASDILLPLVGFSIAVFAGWIMSKGSTADEFNQAPNATFRAWRFLLRFVAPLSILIVLFRAIEMLSR